jgi:hypothetical protein
MTVPWLQGSAAFLTVLGVAAVLRAATVPLAPPPAIPDAPAPAVTMARDTTVPWDSLETLVVARDLFQRERRPPPEAPAPGEVLPAEPTAPTMNLRLVGIVAGARPSAVVLGLPSVAGPRLVLEGDRVGNVTVRRIARDTVVLSVADSLIRLTIREPWQ